ncbi:hypothetical protein [Maribacter arenosus]|uniref:Uncharacterized protein n=1 Tax=Maribacter arenosus TaxID=1854708 RepID=A0ABR7VD58_9FLAO|nr:hypothetical protein [Maribacter arenosus]MBD0850097.1 hypothetical protein [Maribacter arenosus]
MKTKQILLISILGILTISASQFIDDILSRLGIEEQYAQSNIRSNFIGRFDNGPLESPVGENTFKVPYAKLLPSIIAGDKTGAAKELCHYIKNYINSEEFIIAYNEMRYDALPLWDSQDPNRSSLGILKSNLKVFELNIKNYPNDVAYVAEQKKLKEQTQASIDNIMEASKKPFPNKELWEQTYPENPEVLVKKRLQEYLALVNTVDFSAKLTAPDNYKIQKFENPNYERKSPQWKACYRAGKDVNDVFTSFANEWLKGEIIASVKTKMPDRSIASKEETKSNAIATTTPVNENNTTQVEDAPAETGTMESVNVTAKAKKSLLDKMKEKAKKIVN